MGWPCSANVTHSPTQRCPQMDPNSRRKRGRPKETWRRTAEKEMKEQGWTRGYVERCVADRPLWRALVATYVYDHGGELWWRHMCINARRGLSKFATEQGHLRTTPPPSIRCHMKSIIPKAYKKRKKSCEYKRQIYDSRDDERTPAEILYAHRTRRS